MPFKLPKVIGQFVGVDFYNTINVFSFMKWLEDEKEITDLDNIDRDRVIDFVAEYLELTDGKSGWVNVESALHEIKSKGFLQANTRFGFKKQKDGKKNEGYTKFKKSQYSMILLFPYAERHKGVQFFEEYKMDLEAVTADYLTAFYSENDTLLKSGYSIVNEFSRINNKKVDLPAMIIWKNRLLSQYSKVIPIQGLSSGEIFDEIRHLVFSMHDKTFSLVEEETGTVEEKGKLKDLAEIKVALSTGNTKQALELLGKQLINPRSAVYNQYVVINYQYSSLQKQRLEGVITNEEYDVKRAKIVISILGFVDALGR